MYLIVEEYDLAIAMYKKCAQYDNMIRLVSKYRSNLLKETHLAVAQKLHKDGNFKAAEQHYIAGASWRAAVEMYKSQGLWEEAGMKMLLKMNLVDAVVEYLSDKSEFDEAFKMANLHAKHKIRDVHLKFAFKLEDEKRYKEAEAEFIKAGKALEAISMYENVGDFHSALTVAGQAVQLAVTYEKDKAMKVAKIVCGRLCEIKAFDSAGELLEQINLFEEAVGTYCEGGNYDAARQCAKMINNPDLNAKLNDYIDRKQR
ncbi:unnamed protein product [Sphagnum balticum]